MTNKQLKKELIKIAKELHLPKVIGKQWMDPVTGKPMDKSVEDMEEPFKWARNQLIYRTIMKGKEKDSS